MKKLNQKTVTFRIEDSQLELIAKYSDKMDMNRSQLLRNVIRSGLDDLKLMDRTGFLALAIKGRNLLDIVRTSIDDDKFEVKDDKLVIDL